MEWQSAKMLDKPPVTSTPTLIVFPTFQLISDAIRYGDRHKHTMEMADYWLDEKQLVHKLFKVLVPRYKDSKTSFTRMVLAPNTYPGKSSGSAVLELRGSFNYTALNIQVI